jgi:hypothetical protein
VPPLLLGRALPLAAFRPGLLVARLASLLCGPGPGAIVPPFVPPLHALRLRGRGTDAQHHQRRDHHSGALAYETLAHARLLCAATAAGVGLLASRWLRMPRMPATGSMGRLPLRPREACHPVHGKVRNDPSASQFLVMRCLPASPIFASWHWPLNTERSM